MVSFVHYRLKHVSLYLKSAKKDYANISIIFGLYMIKRTHHELGSKLILSLKPS